MMLEIRKGDKHLSLAAIMSWTMVCMNFKSIHHFNVLLSLYIDHVMKPVSARTFYFYIELCSFLSFICLYHCNFIGSYLYAIFTNKNELKNYIFTFQYFLFVNSLMEWKNLSFLSMFYLHLNKYCYYEEILTVYKNRIAEQSIVFTKLFFNCFLSHKLTYLFLLILKVI